MSQTKKKLAPISFNNVAPTTIEKRELQTIIESPHWARRKLKDSFVAQYNRRKEEVEEYVRSRARRWSKDEYAQIPESETEIELEPAIELPEPKGTIIAKAQTQTQAVVEQSYSPLAGTEMRIPFKKLRIEGNTLVIEF